MNLDAQLLLLVWGMLVGLDLVSVPQMMIARPIVAGPIAGGILGDVTTGLQLGVLFELFQYDVLPVGGARSPEYGPATVAAVSAADAATGMLGIGIGALVGLVTGIVGGISMHLLRRINARAVHAAQGPLEAGDTRVLVSLHAMGILRDATRAGLVTALGLGLAQLAGIFVAGQLTVRGATLLAVAAVAAALAAGAVGTLRVLSGGPHLRWLVAGALGGTVLAWLR
jgi:PTS system mannose-specific IIC component